jgi:hypothetical protein
VLRIWRSGLPDEDLTFIPALNMLAAIDLDGNPLTDACIPILLSAPKLHGASWNDTQVPNEAESQVWDTFERRYADSRRESIDRSNTH